VREKTDLLTGTVGIDNIQPQGASQPVGSFKLTLPEQDGAATFRLCLSLVDNDDAQITSNEWTVYGYPRAATVDFPGCATDVERVQRVFPELKRIGDTGVRAVVVSELTDDVLRFLENGGRVVLLSLGELPEKRERYNELFRGVPWHNGSDGNEGTIIYDHPVMNAFPHDGWCAAQFADLIFGSYPLHLDPVTDPPLKPIIRCLDHYKAGRHKAYLYELQVGKGRLIATTLLVEEMLATHPEAQFLLRQILRYASGNSLAHASTVSVEHLHSLLPERNENRVVDALANTSCPGPDVSLKDDYLPPFRAAWRARIHLGWETTTSVELRFVPGPVPDWDGSVLERCVGRWSRLEYHVEKIGDLTWRLRFRPINVRKSNSGRN